MMTAVPRALNGGSLFFADIEVNQLSSEALHCLQSLANAGEESLFTRADIASFILPSANLVEVERELLLRELIMAIPGGFQFSIEMIRQWFINSSLYKGSTR